MSGPVAFFASLRLCVSLFRSRTHAKAERREGRTGPGGRASGCGRSVLREPQNIEYPTTECPRKTSGGDRGHSESAESRVTPVDRAQDEVRVEGNRQGHEGHEVSGRDNPIPGEWPLLSIALVRRWPAADLRALRVLRGCLWSQRFLRSNFAGQRCLKAEGAVEAIDGFVDFLAALEADDDGIDFRACHGEASGFLAVCGIAEITVAD